MNKLLVFINITFLINAGIRAQNLVPNGGFEHNNAGMVSEWLQPLDEFYHYETNTDDNNGKVVINSFNGLCLIFPRESEYLVVKLKEQLIKGKTYCARMDILFDRPGLNLHNLKQAEWKFMSIAPFVEGRTKLYTEPDVVFEIDSNEEWGRFIPKMRTYKAKGNESYLVIGKFFNREIDSLYNEIYLQRAALNKEYEQKVMDINDSIFHLYPPIPASAGRNHKNKEARAFDAEVKAIDMARKERIQNLQSLYMGKMDKLQFADGMHAYNIRTYFDNICIAPERNSECICNDSTEQPGLIPGNTYRLNGVNFATGSYLLDERSRDELDKLVSLLKQHPSVHIKLLGHTDNTHTSGSNLLLSQNRAKACHTYLVQKGIDESRLGWAGFGDTKPLTSNAGEEGRSINRRVEFVVE